MKNLTTQHIKELIAFLVAALVNHYYSATQGFLLPLTAVCVMQTTIGSSFYQGVKQFSLIVILATVFALPVAGWDFFYRIMQDVILGAVIGIAVNILILPRKADVNFRMAIVPLFKKYHDYFSASMNQLLKNQERISNAELEAQLLTLPDWVYARGFDRRLQTGYEFFLMTLEQISDVLFALHHLASCSYSPELLEKIHPALLSVTEQVSQFLQAVTQVLELEKITENTVDFVAGIERLEKEFYQVAPANLELLDMREEYVKFAELIYSLKDFIKLLLTLREALRF